MPKLIGFAMLFTSTENCVEKHLLVVNLVVLEKVMVSLKQLVDQERHVGNARILCNSTENDKPIIIMYFFVLFLYGNFVY